MLPSHSASTNHASRDSVNQCSSPRDRRPRGNEILAEVEAELHNAKKRRCPSLDASTRNGRRRLAPQRKERPVPLKPYGSKPSGRRIRTSLRRSGGSVKGSL